MAQTTTTTAKAVKHVTIGYMRLKDGIPATTKKHYSAELRAAGATTIVDEQVGAFSVRPKFDRTLKSLTPGGTLVVIRETHLSANEGIAKGLMGRIAQAGVTLKVLHTLMDKNGHFHGGHFVVLDGGDGGGNGGGGGGGGGDGGGGG